MPENRLQRTRDSYPLCFQTGHNFIVMRHSDIAHAIGPTGLRVTWWFCVDCGLTKNYTRTQEEFLKELNK